MKKALAIPAVALAAMMLTGCSTEADRVSYNLSQQADNFNDVRQITVINCLKKEGENMKFSGYIALIVLCVFAAIGMKYVAVLMICC